MTTLTFTLAVAGVTVNRNTAGVSLQRLLRSVDEPESLEFFQLGALPGVYTPGQSVTLTDSNGVIRFGGQIVSLHPGFSKIGWGIGYRASGYKYLGNTFAVTNSADESGLIQYNLPTTDPRYLASNAGLSVGTMLSRLFTAHATKLTAVGITSFNSSDLTPLTITPTQPVTIQGPAFFSAIDQLLQEWSPRYCCFVDPNTQQIRVLDATAFPSQTLTFGVDPIDPESCSISIDTTQCYTRVLYRGLAWVEAAYLSLVDGSLAQSWTSPEQTAWTWADYVDPPGCTDQGTVSGLTSTSCTCTSSSGSEIWTVNQWSTQEAWVYLINPALTGSATLTYTEPRRISSNAVLTAGGSANLSWSGDLPLTGWGYTEYRIVGQPDGSESDVWRRYTVTNSVVAQHLFAGPFPVPVAWGGNTTLIETTTPVAQITSSTMSFPAQFEIDQVHGQIRFVEPVVKWLNTQANLNTGGASVTAPTDVQALVPYSRGAITASAPGDSGGSVVSITISGTMSGYSSASPPTATIYGNGSGAVLGTPVISGGVITSIPVTAGGSGYTFADCILTGGSGSGASTTVNLSAIVPVYGGGAFTQYGIERTYIIDDFTWIDPRNTASNQAIAAMHLSVLEQPVIEGSISHVEFPSGFDALTIGYSLNIAGSGFATGWETLAAAVRSYTVEWSNQSGEGELHRITFNFSNRRKQASGDALYMHPAFSGVHWWDAGTASSPFPAGLGGAASAPGADAISESGAAGPDDAAPGIGADLGDATSSSPLRARASAASAPDQSLSPEDQLDQLWDSTAQGASFTADELDAMPEDGVINIDDVPTDEELEARTAPDMPGEEPEEID